jgi:hypothetical protein
MAWWSGVTRVVFRHGGKKRRKDRNRTTEILFVKRGSVYGVYPQRLEAMKEANIKETPIHVLTLLSITHKMLGCKRTFPRSITSSKYKKCSVSPTVPAHLQTRTVLALVKVMNRLKKTGYVLV